jgi:hypothetical protein
MKWIQDTPSLANSDECEDWMAIQRFGFRLINGQMVRPHPWTIAKPMNPYELPPGNHKPPSVTKNSNQAVPG